MSSITANSTPNSILIQPQVLADHYTKLAAVSDGCGWTFAAWSFRAKAEAHLKAHEARLFCAASLVALRRHGPAYLIHGKRYATFTRCVSLQGSV